jgi:hypothetical protein
VSANLPRLDRWLDLTGVGAPEVDADEVDREGCEAFLVANPEFPQTARNAAALFEWCDSRDVPCTRKNLEVALRVLTEAGRIEQLPAEAAPEADTSRGVKQVVTDVLAHYVPGADEAVALEKLKDDPALGDRARKARDEKLRLLAGAQRRSLASSDLYRG